MIWAAQEALFGDKFDLGQYVDGAEAVIVGGGTFITPAPEHPELLQFSLRLPTVIFGTGASDPVFSGTDYIPEWLEILQNCAFIGVRGPLSEERICAWGVPSDQVEWIGDPAIYFANTEHLASPSKGELAVNVGRSWGRLYGFDEEGLIRTIIATLRGLADKGWLITLVCAWQPDDVVLEYIADEVPVKSVEHWHDDYAKALNSVKKFDLVICEKLHVGVVAACRAVPFIALNYGDKVLDFCRSVDWEAFCVSTQSLRPDQIWDCVDLLSQRRAEYSSSLAQSVDTLRERLLSVVPRVVRALAGNNR